MGRILTCVLAVLAIATSAAATPATYFFTAGSATITAVDLGDAPASNLVFQGVVPLGGVFVTFDPMANGGNGAVTDLNFTVPMTGTFVMNQIYGGFDRFIIESANVLPGTGFNTTSSLNFGGGLYGFDMGPLDINGNYSAFLSTNTNISINNVMVPFTDTSSISGGINLGTGVLDLFGITLAELDGNLFGEAGNLSIKADITFTGIVPEPAVAVLVGGGLAVLGLARRRSLKRNGRVC